MEQQLKGMQVLLVYSSAADCAAWEQGRRVKGGAEQACSNSKREWTSQPRAATFGMEAWASQRMGSRVQAHHVTHLLGKLS